LNKDIEVLQFEGAGKIQITGKLGDVMKESAQAALSYVRSIAKDLKVNPKKFHKYDFHIHVPDGATPKDGPSAGVALCVALASMVSGKAVRKDVAMTGEISLSGAVREIGGLKEKLLAAVRGGIKTATYRVGIEFAKTRQRQGGIRRFRGQHQQLNLDERLGSEHHITACEVRLRAKSVQKQT
jgi:predicted ATP-dependent Lon-type protease